MSAQPIRGAFAHRLPNAIVFRAWRLSGEVARPLDIGQPVDLAEALAAAQAHFWAHKDRLFIHERNDARRTGTLHAYALRKKKAIYVRNPLSGLSERVELLDTDLLFSLPVDAFEPTRAFDALRDDPVGRDLTLVES